MSRLTFFPPPGAKGRSRLGHRWPLAALLVAPLTAWAGFANDDRSFDSQTTDIDAVASGQSFMALSSAGDEAGFPWAGRDVLTTEYDWQAGWGNSLMPIPEPQAAAMWLVGLVAIGFIARRRSGG